MTISQDKLNVATNLNTPWHFLSLFADVDQHGDKMPLIMGMFLHVNLACNSLSAPVFPTTLSVMASVSCQCITCGQVIHNDGLFLGSGEEMPQLDTRQTIATN